MFLKHKIRKKPNNLVPESNIDIVEKTPKFKSKKYKLILFFNLFLITTLSVSLFFNNPFLISTRLFNPFLILAIVSWVLLLINLVFQSIILFIHKKKFRPFHHLIIILTALTIISPIIGLTTIVLQVISYILLNTKKMIIINSFVFGALALFLIPVTGFLTLIGIGLSTQMNKNETTSYTIQDSDSNLSSMIKHTSSGAVPEEINWLNVMSWNIGYASTGSEADYFYGTNNAGEKGKTGKAKDLATVNAHLSGIKQFIKKAVTGGDIVTSFDDHRPLYDKDGNKILANMKTVKIPKVDFGMLQEVDRPSVRSMYTNQPKIIANLMPDYDVQFINNFKVGILPVPLMDPNGQVDAGLLSFSAYNIDAKKARRISLNSAGSGLDGIFNLKRAIGLTDFKVDNGKTLHMANIHMSAFPEDLLKRNKEYLKLIQLLIKWEKDNDYFVIGGDWNTDILDAYYYVKAKDTNSGSGQKNSQLLNEKNTFNYGSSPKHPSQVQPLNDFDIAKFPDSFRKYMDAKNNDKKLRFGVDAEKYHTSMRSAGQKWQGPEALKENGKPAMLPYRSSDYVPSQAIIDGFLTSHNILVDEVDNPVQTIQQGWHPNPMNPEHRSLYADSDHNPIIMKFALI